MILGDLSWDLLAGHAGSLRVKIGLELSAERHRRAPWGLEEFTEYDLGSQLAAARLPCSLYIAGGTPAGARSLLAALRAASALPSPTYDLSNSRQVETRA